MITERLCPFCGKKYKAQGFDLWKVNLYQHLIGPISHNLDSGKARKLLPNSDMKLHRWKQGQALHILKAGVFIENSETEKLEYFWVQDLNAPHGEGHIYERLRYGQNP